MAINEKVRPFLLLELGHFRNNIAANDGRVAPIGFFQFRGENVLLYTIKPVGPLLHKNVRTRDAQPKPGAPRYGATVEQHPIWIML